jgi:hypothetical protein
MPLMESLSQAIEVVRRAEGDLRQLLLHAAEQADYDTTRVLAEWARQLKELAQQGGTAAPRPGTFAAPSAQTGASADQEAVVTTDHKRTVAGNLKATEARGRTKPNRDYPKFLRDGEDLLKMGWSKREKKVYRHKAPHRVVLLVSQALQRAGQNGHRFIMEKILPIRDPENDTDVPAYQAYLSLAWFRKEKLIVQHGRKGYSLGPNVKLMDMLEDRWKLLPKA